MIFTWPMLKPGVAGRTRVVLGSFFTLPISSTSVTISASIPSNFIFLGTKLSTSDFGRFFST